MDFDPSFAENFSYLVESLPEVSSKKSENPFMVPVQPISTISPHPSHSNYNNFQQHPLDEANYYSNFSMEGPSSISPFNLIQTPSLGNSFKATHTSGSITDFLSASHPMAISPNNYQMDVMNGYMNNGNNNLDFVSKNALQYNVTSQSQVGPSISPLLFNDAPAYVPMKHMLQEELSHIIEIGNNLLETNLRLNIGDQNEQMRVEMNNNESHHSDTNRIKGQWTIDEDRTLIELVNQYGLKNWSRIAKFLDGRNGKQCRERWNNHLRSDIRKDSWSEEEEKLLIDAHKQVGNKWAEIARRLPGRTENTIKNHWNTIKRSLNRKGKQIKSKDDSNGTLLKKYIKKVTNVEGGGNEMNQSMRMVNIGSK